jgi:hypothetical protein
MKIIAVLGMHRSGTSLCARICQELSVYLGTNLLSGDTHNPEGYFEDQSIMACHHNLLVELNHLGRGSHADPWWEDPQLEPYARHLAAAILRLQGDAGDRNVGFKDPRTLNFLSFWKHLFERLGLEPRLVLAVRHPQAVYYSLARRNGLSREYAEFLWLVHNLSAMVEWTRPLLLPVVYERWFGDPDAQLAQLSGFIGCEPRQFERAAARLQETIHAGLNHAPALYRGEHSETAARFYDFLLNASREGGIRQAPMDLLGACEDRMHALAAMLNVGAPRFGFKSHHSSPQL